MSAISKAQAQQQLDAWLDASIKVAKGQSVTIAGRSLTMADASVINKNIQYWERKVSRSGSGLKVVQGVAR